MGLDGEVLLTGGNVAAAVVRIGSTVRKPAVPATPAVEALLEHLERAGVDGAPRSLGRTLSGGRSSSSSRVRWPTARGR